MFCIRRLVKVFIFVFLLVLLFLRGDFGFREGICGFGIGRFFLYLFYKYRVKGNIK